MDQYDMGSDSEETMRISVKSAEAVSSDDSSNVKICTDCGTTRTPLWRGGPAGPKTLCNACGIRSRKKRRALLGLNKNSTIEQKAAANAAAAARNGKRCGGESTGKDIAVKRSTVRMKLRRKMKMGEVEQAAVLLMALSCGSFYA